MTPATVETFTDADPREALVVVAFHSAGAAAAIAATYLRQSFSLPLVGHIPVEGLGPVVNVQDGIATSPIRIFGGEVECKLDKGCPRLYLVIAEMPIDPKIVEDVAQAVLHWAGSSRMVLCLDAVLGTGDSDPTVYAIADDAETLAVLAPTKAPPLAGGFLAGMTAAVLATSRGHGVHGAALVVEAREDHPDARAAAALVTHLDPLMPEVQVDLKPLLAEAEMIEAQLARALADAKAARAPRVPHTFI